MASSMLQKGNPEETMSCPYNKAHQILRSRMQTHLVRCAAEHPHMKLVDCPYNATHRLSSPEFYHHVETCPDRYKLDTYVYANEKVNFEKFPIQNTPIEIPAEESWDSVNVPAYDPNTYCENNKILRQMKVQSAGKRKNFRYEERLRYQNMKSALVEPEDREKASDYAKRAASKNSVVNVEEQEDLFHTIPLMERVQMGDSQKKVEEKESKKDLPDMSSLQLGVAEKNDKEFPALGAIAKQGDKDQRKYPRGFGRGKFLKK